MTIRTSRVLLSALLLVATTFTFAQNPTPPPTPRQSRRLQTQVPQLPEQLKKDLERIQQHALDNDAAYMWLKHLCNNIGPRLSGSAQADKAVEYVADEMRKLGAKVTLEPVMVPHWVRGAESAELVEFPGMAAGTTQKIVVTALGGSTATPAEGVTAEVVVVRDVAELQALPNEKVKGKIVVFTSSFDVRMAESGNPMEAYGRAVRVRGNGAAYAAEKGAVASVIRSVGDSGSRVPHTGAMFPPAGMKTVPGAAATSEDIDTIADLASQGTVRMHLTLTPQTLPDVESHNVIADIVGTEHPEQVVILSGHLDSWDLGRGAIDDGAGVVSAMQVARTLHDLGLKPKRTIRIIAWMNEENGARGGEAYAKDYGKDAANHLAAIEFDSGAGHSLGYAIHAPKAFTEKLAPMGVVLARQGADIVRTADSAPGADISPLDPLGIPTLGIMNDNRDYFHYHHTPADTFSIIDRKFLQENAAAMAVLGYGIANLDLK